MSLPRLRLPDVLAEVRALELPGAGWAVFGSGPMLAHGLIPDVGDLDLVATGAAWARALELGPAETGPGGDRVVRLGRIELFDGWMGLELGALLERAELLYGLRWASLRDVLEFKERLERPKDAEHLRLLRAHLG